MDKPLEPGVRKKGRNTYQVSTEYLKEDIKKMGPDNFKEIMKQRKRKAQAFKKGGLSAKQKKIAAKAPPPDKIDAKDFAVLKAEKAKGRGMGLQDESIKPGKVMKARMGKAVKYKKYLMGLKKATEEVKEEQKKNKFKKKYSVGGVSSKEVYTNARANVDAEGRKNMTMKDLKEARRETYSTKKMAGGMAKKYSVGGGADTGTAGERRSSMYVLLDKMKRRRAEDRITKRDLDMPSRRSRPAYAIGEAMKDRDRLTNIDIKQATNAIKPSQRKMGGGMMNKPMGYKSGTMVKARGCKLGRTRPTKMY